jgi:hypothetical protein
MTSSPRLCVSASNRFRDGAQRLLNPGRKNSRRAAETQSRSRRIVSKATAHPNLTVEEIARVWRHGEPPNSGEFGQEPQELARIARIGDRGRLRRSIGPLEKIRIPLILGTDTKRYLYIFTKYWLPPLAGAARSAAPSRGPAYATHLPADGHRRTVRSNPGGEDCLGVEISRVFSAWDSSFAAEAADTRVSPCVGRAAKIRQNFLDSPFDTLAEHRYICGFPWGRSGRQYTP